MVGCGPRPPRVGACAGAALLSGRSRVELSAEEAVSAIHWAAQLTGWDDWDQHPIFIYPSPDTGQG
jgi:hypothetical protein